MHYILVHRVDTNSKITDHIPLHMTLLHWFELSSHLEELSADLHDYITHTNSLRVKAVSRDMFGPNADIPVTRFERSPELLALHLRLATLAQRHGAIVSENRTGKTNWHPHVSDTATQHFSVGDTMHIISIDLIASEDRYHPTRYVKLFRLNIAL